MPRLKDFDQDAYIRDLQKSSERDESHVAERLPQPGQIDYCGINYTDGRHSYYRNRDGSIGCNLCGYPPKFTDTDGNVQPWSTDLTASRPK